jgi:NADH-quinone oxidoreductase subunit K
MGLAAAEATLVLAIVVVVVRRFQTSDSSAVSELKG